MAAAVAAIGALAMPSLASAKPRPSVSWTVQRGASEGAPIPFSWSGRHLGKNYRLVVQRPVGTARTWKTMLKLNTRRGSAELPAQALGKYRFRLAALRGRRVLASKVVGVGVFGQVPFSVLMKGGYLNFGDLDNGVYATPTASFPYVGSAWVGDHGQPKTVFSVKRNHCTAVHLGFVLGDTPGESYLHPGSIYGVVRLVQQSRDPVTAEVPLNGIGSVDAELTPGQTWSLLVEENSRDGEIGNPTAYFNGYAVCDSAEPFFS
ncbi:MAG: hypothetical protein AB7V58_06355 [Solirubrobacterales bacterium]